MVAYRKAYDSNVSTKTAFTEHGPAAYRPHWDQAAVSYAEFQLSLLLTWLPLVA